MRGFQKSSFFIVRTLSPKLILVFSGVSEPAWFWEMLWPYKSSQHYAECLSELSRLSLSVPGVEALILSCLDFWLSHPREHSTVMFPNKHMNSGSRVPNLGVSQPWMSCPISARRRGNHSWLDISFQFILSRPLSGLMSSLQNNHPKRPEALRSHRQFSKGFTWGWGPSQEKCYFFHVLLGLIPCMDVILMKLKAFKWNFKLIIKTAMGDYIE